MEISKSSGNIKRRRPRRKRMHLYLLNDDINTVDYVIEILSSVLPMCNTLRAEQIAMIVHNNGECNVYNGFPPAIYLLYVKLTKAGLNAQIREYKPKRK